MVDNFSGLGVAELMNFGKNLQNASPSTAPSEFHLYRCPAMTAAKGRVSTVTDGLGNIQCVYYKPLSDGTVYTRGSNAQYPVAAITPALSVVSSVTATGGSIPDTQTTYAYEGLKTHTKGRGLLGFAKVTDIDSGTVMTTAVRRTFKVPYYINDSTYITKTSGSFMSQTMTAMAATAMQGGANYFVHPTTKTETDIYGNTDTTDYSYDPSTCQLLLEYKRFGDITNRRQTTFSNYQLKGGRYLPGTIAVTQKHSDDDAFHYDTTVITYNNQGLRTSVTEHSGTSMPLTRTYTYNNTGKTATETVTGTGVTTHTTTYTYDMYNRLTRATESPSGVTTEYAYDQWNNVVSETDKTRSTYPQATTHTYDDWGRRVSTTAPDGATTSRTTGWGTSAAQRYWVMVQTAARPWVKTWYDARGREVLTETVGPEQTAVSRATAYDSHGNVVSTTSATGSLTLTNTMTYDALNRLSTETAANGRTTTYSYGSRSVTATTGGRTSTKTFDAWGNVNTTTDSVSGVTYTYSSCGQPKTATSEGATITMGYDGAGRRTSISDPDAGLTTYTYAADGRMLSQTDARGVTTSYIYDNTGFLAETHYGSTVATNTYGTTNADRLLLLSTAMNGDTISYGYDHFGRTISETRKFSDGTVLGYAYSYNSEGLPSQTVYPGGLTMGYQYDTNGYCTAMTANGQTVYQREAYDGLRDSSLLCGAITMTTVRDAYGLPKSEQWYRGTTSLASRNYTFDTPTGNLTKKGNLYEIPVLPPIIDPWSSKNDTTDISRSNPTPSYNLFYDEFAYDGMDRLVGIVSSRGCDTIYYAPNGNILTRSSVGNYSYDSSLRPHAVQSVTNNKGMIPTGKMTTSFNDIGKTDTIGFGIQYTAFNYGPNMQRWVSALSSGSTPVRTVHYGGDYEKVEEDGTTREFYYPGHNVIIVKQGSTFTCYAAVTDNLGSIWKLFDSGGSEQFSAYYDAWGKQTVSTNNIGFLRGFCGHEHLPEYGIINMNGRLYDPVTARFFSPDNHVQEPFNSQSFNRYSYCLNNPLKYTDPDGELFGTVLALFTDMLANPFKHGMAFWNYNFTKTKNAWKIDMAPLKGNLIDNMANTSWGLFNTSVGNVIGQFANITGMVDGVSDIDGLTAVGGVNASGRAFTVGPYSFGPDGYKATWKDHLFVHEYGHYRQHILLGPVYLGVVGAPSLASEIGLTGGVEHDYRWFEIDASRRGAKHFDKKYGSGKDGYVNGDANYFDINSFTTGSTSAYINPRTGNQNYKNSHPVSGAEFTHFDYLVPVITPIILSIIF